MFLIIYLGFILRMKFELHVKSFSNLCFYLIIPAFVLVQVYQININLILIKPFVFTILFIIIIYFISFLISKIRKHTISKANAFKNSILFFNVGSFGIPLIIIIFQENSLKELAISTHLIVFLVLNILIFSLGLYNAAKNKFSLKESMNKIFSMPVLYAIILGLILKFVNYDFTQNFLWTTLTYLENSFMPITLITLGIQLSSSSFYINDIDIYLASLIKLLLSPFIAYILIHFLNISGVMAQTLFISFSSPTAMIIALISIEFDNKPIFSSQVVLLTTLLSPLTITLIIWVSRTLF